MKQSQAFEDYYLSTNVYLIEDDGKLCVDFKACNKSIEEEDTRIMNLNVAAGLFQGLYAGHYGDNSYVARHSWETILVTPEQLGEITRELIKAWPKVVRALLEEQD